MSEYATASLETRAAPAASVAIGGLLTRAMVLPMYRRLLGPASQSGLTAKDRFIPVPGSGVDTLEECYSDIESQLLSAYERLEEPMLLLGHSIGGLFGTMFALRQPDKTADVVCLAGAQEGIAQETPSSWALRKLLGNPEAGEQLRADSDFMRQHRQHVTESWPTNVSLHLISPTVDDMLLAPQGLGLQLPQGRQPERQFVAPPVWGMHQAIRRIPGMPSDVQLLPSWRPVGHVDIPSSGAVITYVRNLAALATANTSVDESIALSSSGFGLPAAA